MQQDKVQIPTEALKPILYGDLILTDLLRESYGLTVTDVMPLNGYDDLNFHVQVSPSHCNPHLGQVSSPSGYFLKIINVQDSQRPDYLNAQVNVMEHLLKKGIQCQTIIKSVNGELFTKCTTQNKNGEDISYLVSLRSFIPGQILQQVAMTPDFLYRLGQYVADVTSALQDFYHPFYDTFDCTWSLNSVPKLANILFAVRDTHLRQICEEVVQTFQEEVTLFKSEFRKGQIHGDLNEQNVLVNNFALSPAETTESSPFDRTAGVSSLDGDQAHVCGLLDFQDTAFSYPLYDLAIMVCYMLMTYSEVPLLDIPGYILAGYESKLHLIGNERTAFRTCVAARMVQSLAMGAYTHHMDPSNDYVLTTGKHGWQALETFWSADKEQSEARWDLIVRTFKPRP